MEHAPHEPRARYNANASTAAPTPTPTTATAATTTTTTTATATAATPTPTTATATTTTTTGCVQAKLSMQTGIPFLGDAATTVDDLTSVFRLVGVRSEGGRGAPAATGEYSMDDGVDALAVAAGDVCRGVSRGEAVAKEPRPSRCRDAHMHTGKHRFGARSNVTPAYTNAKRRKENDRWGRA